MARRLTLLFAALLAALALAPSAASADAQNRVGAFLSAAPTHTGAIAAESACTHPASAAGQARIAQGCCVAARGAGRAPASSAAQGVRLRGQLTAEQIAGGHAYKKHAHEFPGIRSQGQFKDHIEDVILNPTQQRQLAGGRQAWWRQDSGTVVIRDPRSPDGGTAFRPRNGYSYFRDNLR